MKNWTLPIILIIAVAAAFYFLGSCQREIDPTIKYVKGQPKVVYTKGKSDTVTKVKEVYLKAKSTVKTVYDTVHHWHTAKDTVQLYPYTLLIQDTLREGRIDRDIIMTGYDSTFFVTRVDTVEKTRVDTLKIETAKKAKGAGILCAVCFGAGIVVGSTIP